MWYLKIKCICFSGQVSTARALIHLAPNWVNLIVIHKRKDVSLMSGSLRIRRRQTNHRINFRMVDWKVKLWIYFSIGRTDAHFSTIYYRSIYSGWRCWREWDEARNRRWVSFDVVYVNALSPRFLAVTAHHYLGNQIMIINHINWLQEY